MTNLTNEQIDVIARDWPGLTSASVVVEVGGFEGRWACDMAQRYGVIPHVVEPQRWCWERIADRFAAASLAYVLHPFALGHEDRACTLHEYHTDGASLVADTREAGEARMADAARWWGVACPAQIDLLLMNIEGYEYELLHYLKRIGAIENTAGLMVQFHRHADPNGEREAAIRAWMSYSHSVRFDLGPTLVGWERRR